MMLDFLTHLGNSFLNAGVNPSDQEYLNRNLEKFHQEIPVHYEHSVRVGDLCYRASEILGLDSAIIHIGGVFHDIGKILLPPGSLENKGFNLENVKPHPELSYKILNSVKSLPKVVSEMGLRHHTFRNGETYPKDLPTIVSDEEFSCELITRYCLWCSIFDKYDAMRTRINDGYSARIKSREETLRTLKDLFFEQTEVLDLLTHEKILH